MRIVIAGGSGFIGQPLVEELARAHEVAVLTRNASGVKAGRAVPWQPGRAGEWQDEIAGADAVINLAGENIGEGRWTLARKRALLESRLTATSAIVEVLRAHPRPDCAFVSASAIGYYGSRGDEQLDESSAAGNDFLSEVCRKWEESARGAEEAARVVIPRFGIVLAADGGALSKMLLPFRLFAGGPQGSGRQWMSWIDRDDAITLIRWAVENPSVRGVYNAVAPQPVRNAEFARQLGRALRRPAVLPAPAFALRTALGEMADALLLSSQRVTPVRSAAEGFACRYPLLEQSLRHILG